MSSPASFPASSPISLDGSEERLAIVCRLFANATGLRFVFQEPAFGTIGVSVTCKANPWDEALLRVLEGTGLSFVYFRDAGVVVIVPAPERPS